MTRELYDSEDRSRNNNHIMAAAAANSSGFVYSSGTVSSNNNPITSGTHHDHLIHHHQNQIQGFESNPSDHHQNQIFSLTANMGMIDFTKHHHHHQMEVEVEHQTSTVPTGDENNLFLEESSNPMRCTSVFPCEGNERPSQGLSLSLSSSNPTSISLQSFELRSQTQPQVQDHTVKVVGPRGHGYFGKSEDHHHHIQQSQMMMMMMNGYDQFQIRGSKYLSPAQELLNEFCSIGTKQSDELIKQKNRKGKQPWDNNSVIDESAATCSRTHNSSLGSLEFLELQKRKSKLRAMLEELDRRYRTYCNQMKEAVAGFEAIAGVGSAGVYTALASKAMSRHFRCLRDGLVGQMMAVRKAMGEKDPAVPGTTRGETPRLRILDQAFRQQKAYQQMSLLESPHHPWRPQRGLPERSVSILRAWLFEHFLHPYPSDVDKHILAGQTGLSKSQVSNWFINARVRLWKPMVEEMYLEEAKEQGTDVKNIASSSHHGPSDFRDNTLPNNIQNRPMVGIDFPKAEPTHLNTRVDPESLSSVVSNKHDVPTRHNYHNQGSTFGSTTFDHFSGCYTGGQDMAYAGVGDGSNHGYEVETGGGGGDVSLTLGLQQHGGGDGGVSLAFSPASQGGAFFYGGGSIEDCQQGVNQYTLLDAEQAQNLPYRNLMGAQLLHDMV